MASRLVKRRPPIRTVSSRWPFTPGHRPHKGLPLVRRKLRLDQGKGPAVQLGGQRLRVVVHRMREGRHVVQAVQVGVAADAGRLGGMNAHAVGELVAGDGPQPAAETVAVPPDLEPGQVRRHGGEDFLNDVGGVGLLEPGRCAQR